MNIKKSISISEQDYLQLTQVDEKLSRAVQKVLECIRQIENLKDIDPMLYKVMVDMELERLKK